MQPKSARALIAEMESLRHELALTRCRCCGRPLNTYVQPAINPALADLVYGTCFNTNCARYTITRELEDLYNLTDEQVATFHTRINKS